MGYIKYNGIIVTGDDETIGEVHEKVCKIYDDTFDEHFIEEKERIDQETGREYSRRGRNLVGNIVSGLMNHICSFFIAPDGSKKGWETSQVGDLARENAIEYLDTTDVDYVEVLYGGDDSHTAIVGASNHDASDLLDRKG